MPTPAPRMGPAVGNSAAIGTEKQFKLGEPLPRFHLVAQLAWVAVRGGAAPGARVLRDNGRQSRLAIVVRGNRIAGRRGGPGLCTACPRWTPAVLVKGSCRMTAPTLPACVEVYEQGSYGQ